MIKNSPSKKANGRLPWLSKPSPGHLVHYYKSDDELLQPLTPFIREGLLKGDTCVIIATKQHTDQLNTRLLESGIDIDDAYARGNYITLDASATLAGFMVNGLPDKKLFHETVGELIAKTTKNSSVRAFGEMVALLWKSGNKEAVLSLEKLWNGLAEKSTFSLYCAYPELHFVMDKEARQEITDCHNLMPMHAAL